MINEELRRLATEANVTTSHVGATQEIWDAINVDLQQILDDVSCWEGRHAERMCERLETAIKRLNAAVGNEREGYETAIAVGYENDALRTRLAEVEKDAARWGFIRKKWKTVNLRFKKRPNVLAGFTLTVSMENNHSDAYYLEKEIDAAISGETNGQN